MRFKIFKLISLLIIVLGLNTNTFSGKHTMAVPQTEKFSAIQNEIANAAEIHGISVSVDWRSSSPGKYIAIFRSHNEETEVSFSESEIVAAQSKQLHSETVEKINNSIDELLQSLRTGNKGAGIKR